MGSASEKLYPPVIGGALPAFYKETENAGTVTITVPFSMNRAVSANQISGFAIKIKTVQSNTYIITLRQHDVATSIHDGEVKFTWFTDDNDINREPQYFSKIVLGQFVKIQMAYIDLDGGMGYFSTVGIAKYTAKPNVYIQGLNSEIDANAFYIFKSAYVGVYENTNDPNERPYSYCFQLYDESNILIETSGWRLHNSSVNSLEEKKNFTLDQTIDTYTFTSSLQQNLSYYIQYGVRTINNVEIFSPLYTCIDAAGASPRFEATLIVENVFDEGFIKLTLDASNYDGNTNIAIEISRADETTNFNSWSLLTKAYFETQEMAEMWYFRDFTVEQGVTYQYRFREYDANGFKTQPVYSARITADFEDIFLYDGEKQVKVRFNPQVSSFKATRLESKMDTLGSQFPFIFRNNVVNYKEFPIAGLISYIADNNQLFVNYEDDLNITPGNEPRRTGTHPDINDDSYKSIQTLDLTGYNVRAERLFKMKLLNWLSDGKVKLFKSPTEGNYLVRLLNISLSPEKALGRMLHNFSATAYEIAAYNYLNLSNYGFFKPEDITKVVFSTQTIKLRDVLSGHSDSRYTSSFKLNAQQIYNFLRIELCPSPGLWFRIGNDRPEDKVLISPATGYQLIRAGALDDVYFNVADNGISTSAENISAAVIDLVQDAQMTYTNYSVITYTSDAIVNEQETVAFRNVVKTFHGGDTISFRPYLENGRQIEVIEVFKLAFRFNESADLEEYSNTTCNIVTLNEQGQASTNTVILDESSNLVQDTSDITYMEIRLGAGVDCDCAYRERIVLS